MTGHCLPSTDHREDPNPLAAVVSTAVTAGTLLVAFGLLAAGVESFWIVFPVGFGGVLPLSVGLLGSAQDKSDPERVRGNRRDVENELERLRQRYAAGELTDEEFENCVEALLETEGSN